MQGCPFWDHKSLFQGANMTIPCPMFMMVLMRVPMVLMFNMPW